MQQQALEEFDVVVLGGGTAGCVSRAWLAEAGHRTVIVEAGPTDLGRDEVARVRRWPELLGGELDWDFTIEPQPRGNSAIRHSRARVLGGCSSHNSCIAFVPPDRDFRCWEDAGAVGWGPAAVAPAFDRVLASVHTEQVGSENPVNSAVLEACAGVGLGPMDFRGKDWFHPGAGRFWLNVHDGRRQLLLRSPTCTVATVAAYPSCAATRRCWDSPWRDPVVSVSGQRPGC